MIMVWLRLAVGAHDRARQARRVGRAKGARVGGRAGREARPRDAGVLLRERRDPGVGGDGQRLRGVALAPAALVFVGTFLMLWWRPPDVPPWALWVGFALQVALVLGTALWWGPLMARLEDAGGGLALARRAWRRSSKSCANRRLRGTLFEDLERAARNVAELTRRGASRAALHRRFFDDADLDVAGCGGGGAPVLAVVVPPVRARGPRRGTAHVP